MTLTLVGVADTTPCEGTKPPVGGGGTYSSPEGTKPVVGGGATTGPGDTNCVGGLYGIGGAMLRTPASSKAEPEVKVGIG